MFDWMDYSAEYHMPDDPSECEYHTEGVGDCTCDEPMEVHDMTWLREYNKTKKERNE